MNERKLLPKLIGSLAIVLAGFALSAQADINVGVTLSATGPAASLGIPEKNTIALMPQTIGGEKVTYIVLDDGSDATAYEQWRGETLDLADRLEALAAELVPMKKKGSKS